LLQAEVNWGKAAYATALGEANFIRTNDGGLAADTSVAADSVLNTILYDKRYSLLWQSGSRWLDARMFGKLNANPPPAGVGVERSEERRVGKECRGRGSWGTWEKRRGVVVEWRWL